MKSMLPNPLVQLASEEGQILRVIVLTFLFGATFILLPAERTMAQDSTWNLIKPMTIVPPLTSDEQWQNLIRLASRRADLETVPGFRLYAVSEVFTMRISQALRAKSKNVGISGSHDQIVALKAIADNPRAEALDRAVIRYLIAEAEAVSHLLRTNSLKPDLVPVIYQTEAVLFEQIRIVSSRIALLCW